MLSVLIQLWFCLESAAVQLATDEKMCHCENKDVIGRNATQGEYVPNTHNQQKPEIFLVT